MSRYCQQNKVKIQKEQDDHPAHKPRKSLAIYPFCKSCNVCMYSMPELPANCPKTKMGNFSFLFLAFLEDETQAVVLAKWIRRDR